MATPNYNNPVQGIPTDKVLQLRSSGLSNNQIIQSLQREGYMQSQIFDAMNQAEVKMGVTNIQSEYLQSYEPSNPMSMGAAQQMPPPPQQGGVQQQGMRPQQGGGYSPDMGIGNFGLSGSVTTEELIEALIDEKWNELLKDIAKIADWKEKADTRLVRMEQSFEDLKKNFETLHKAVIGKIGEYDKHILDVGAEIQAMEKVFQKVLPTFVENVNELSRITDNIKKK